jgi:hypothetical protein
MFPGKPLDQGACLENVSRRSAPACRSSVLRRGVGALGRVRIVHPRAGKASPESGGPLSPTAAALMLHPHKSALRPKSTKSRLLQSRGASTPRRPARAWRSFDFCWRSRLASKCLGAPQEKPSCATSYNLFTKLAQSSGPESSGPERTLSTLLALRQVNSPSRVSFRKNDKFPDTGTKRERFPRTSGGARGPDIQPSLVCFQCLTRSHFLPKLLTGESEGGQRVQRHSSSSGERPAASQFVSASAVPYFWRLTSGLT